MGSLLDRFSGVDGRRHLRNALTRQPLMQGLPEAAKEILTATELQSFAEGEVLMSQNAVDNHIAFILIGRVYEITFWQQFKTYAIVQKTGVPLGYCLLGRREPVQAGDLWCHQGKVHRVWLPTKLFGEQQSNNDYCRKLDLE